MKSILKTFIGVSCIILAAWSCANIGTPEGGPTDRTPPKVVSTTPAANALNNKEKKISIRFDEYVKLENATEKVVISPPQIQQPEITTSGKSIIVKLLDSLKTNSTYSIDFSDAILDNNEGNPLGNYAFTFSTGNHIDTLQVSGYLIDAETLEPVKDVYVGLHADLTDSAFIKMPFDRVSRTDSRGHFIIKGIATGKYHIYALKDADQNFKFNQRSEAIAYNRDLVVPTFKSDTRQDTTWVDSLTYDTIITRGFTHYYPDDLLLRLFKEKSITQYLVKSERTQPQAFSLYFAIPNDTLPRLRGLNFNEKNAFFINKNVDNDSIHYWIKDSLIYKLDTLRIEAKYLYTDTLNKLVPRTDTLRLFTKKFNTFKNKNAGKEKKKKKGELEKKPTLPMSLLAPPTMDIYDNAKITFQEPISKIDTSKIHLWEKVDTTWTLRPYLIKQDSDNIMSYQLLAEWDPGAEYDVKIDSLAFQGLYGLYSDKAEGKMKLKTSNDYANLYMTITNIGPCSFAEVLDGQDKVIRKAKIVNGKAKFYYLNPGKIYVRAIEDENCNGVWDTGDYEKNLQPEKVYYYPHEIELKAMWDIEQNWDVNELPMYKQKPDAIKKQKPDADKKKNVKNNNNNKASN